MDNSDRLFFFQQCPKCEAKGRFDILLCSEKNESIYAEYFYMDDWVCYDFCLFSVVSYCNKCQNYVSANIAVVHDEIKNSTSPLYEFASQSLELKQNKKLIIDFDVRPLIPPQYHSSPPIVDMRDLYEQAKKCYSIRAWDAVGMLCRKIIDVESKRVWNVIYPEKDCPRNMDVRIKKLLIPNIVKRKSVKKNGVEKSLNWGNLKHRLFYDMEQIRYQGNYAVHDNLEFNSADAEGMLIITLNFMDSYDDWICELRTK